MTTSRKLLAGMVLCVAVPLALLVGGPAPAGAQDLDCGAPGVGSDFPVDPAHDPNGFDRDGDGVGCESDGSDTGAQSTSASTASTASTASSASSASSAATAPGGRVTRLAHTGVPLVALAVQGSVAAVLVVVGLVARRTARRARPKHMARSTR